MSSAVYDEIAITITPKEAFEIVQSLNRQLCKGGNDILLIVIGEINGIGNTKNLTQEKT